MQVAAIPSLIKQILLEKDRIFIPGFGTLLRSYVPAKMDHKTNFFHPPSYIFELDRSAQYDDPYLCEVYAKCEAIKRDEAIHRVNEFGEKLKKDLIQRGKAEIEDVIIALREGSDINLFPDPSISFEPYPQVDLSTLWESDESSTGIWWEFSAFISMMLLILAGVYYLVNASKIGPNYPYQSNYPPLIGASNDVKQTEDSILSLNEPKEQQELMLQQSLVDTIDQISSIIIVGAYAEYQNVEQMKSRLIRKGWNVFQDSTSTNLVRIGMVPEEHEDIDQVLGIVRKEIDPEAWVLRKK